MADTKKKPALSSRLMQMKFMQKAVEKNKLLEAEERAAQQPSSTGAAQDEDATMVPVEDIKAEEVKPAVQPDGAAQPASRPGGCRIIYDRAPLPAGLSAGRMSFGAPKPAPEAAAGEQGEQGPGLPATASSAASAHKQPGAAVSDVEMAKVLQQAKPQSKPSKQARPASATDFTSLRERKRSKKG